MDCRWGQKPFPGSWRRPFEWKEWDACALIAEADEKLPLLVDQGDRDDFLATSSNPKLATSGKTSGPSLTLRLQPGYATVISSLKLLDDHLQQSRRALRVNAGRITP